jgi:integrase
MRNIECDRALRSDLRQDADGVWHLHIPETKGGIRRILALPADLTAADIHAIAGEGTHLIPARNPTERATITARAINRFVTTFLPGRKKKAYALRKWAGSLVWSTQGAEAAQAFLGHRSLDTTQRYYARFLRPVRAVSDADRAAILAPAIRASA